MMRPLAIGLPVSLILWGLLIWWLGWAATLTIISVALIVGVWCNTDHID